MTPHWMNGQLMLAYTFEAVLIGSVASQIF
jgi:hypothetical protein